MSDESLRRVLEELREHDGDPTATGSLATELREIWLQYKQGDLDRDEFEYLVNEIIEVRAAEQLADDEVACRWIVKCATVLVSAL